MNGKPFLDGGKGKVFQFSTNVSVARDLNPGAAGMVNFLVYSRFKNFVGVPLY